MNKSPKSSKNKGARSSQSPPAQLDVAPSSPGQATSIIIGNVSPKEGDVTVIKNLNKMLKPVKEGVGGKAGTSPK